MGYSAVPLAKVLQDSLIAWSLLCVCIVFVLLVAGVAVEERRERRRLERALAVARQVLPFRKEPVAIPSRPFRPDIDAHHARHRLWLFPIVAIVLGLIVAVWSIWNVLTT
ncbi:MAG: hypothetical protein F4210_06350 [Holophagales bacterium]|nr:hypothetical protein [Holophagales bacterium]MYF95116.1 hypothetical protein [Holophagales bacterium]